ncbi:MAG: alanine--tRNA ligase [Oscillospiraceae bacterium]|nr:alanine--tRNA ligase [Oscillospiraceae bacterium]
MEWTGLNQLREMYLTFFESREHLRLPSFSLVPRDDNSLLLINAGMAPLKKYFTGELRPPSSRVTTCQKCIRTPDIERVGKTARHGTYFEMLGNFSFGDYFKREASRWAWEFCTEVMRMDTDRLYVSVFQEDDEAWDIWTKEIGVAVDHMARLGREDNFWELGKGPCGPCSEIYYDRGEKYGCGSPHCAVGCDCDRYVEFWNLVFTQFDSDGAGNYSNLEKRNIDTGMGLERLACICQGVDNLFEVDTVQNIMKHVMKIAKIQYHEDEKKDVSLRVITDHIRSTTMLIGDGVLPSNEGRGYVLRRLLRRAARHGRLLGVEEAFLPQLAETVIRENESAYPILAEKRDFILRVVANEEENFSRTIDAGLSLLARMMREAEDGKTLSGAEAFKLSDTFGFPIDLTKEILSEKNMTVDEEEYARLAAEQRDRSRGARKDAGADGWKDSGLLSGRGLSATMFVGYEWEQCDAKILAVEDGVVILDQTPFYAESGGQCGDTGLLNDMEDTGSFVVSAVTKTNDGVYLHHGQAAKELRAGDLVRAVVSAHDREDIRRNHTAAHLLQAALRHVLGSHVEQAGQSVTAQGLRFDFTHFAALTSEEQERIEAYINRAIRAALPVKSETLSLKEAKARGAIALFGEKYGETVRMVSIGEISMELCGGTHAANTGNLGLFRMMSESSVASGVRRIEAVTGENALLACKRDQERLARVAQTLKANSAAELEPRAAAVMAQLKETQRDLDGARAKLSRYAVRELLQNAKELGGVCYISGTLESADGLRQACDAAKQSGENVAALFGAKTEKGTLQFAAACAPGAVSAGAHAGNLAKAAAQASGGGGGGRPDSAMAGGKDPSRLAEAMEAAEAALTAMLK